MPPVLLVALGGAAGAVLRYLVGRAVGATAFPWATLCVNVAGCFGIGLGLAWLQRAAAAGTLGPERAADLRLLVVVGLLGGLTTFSAFGQETVALARGGALGAALASVVLNVGLGCAAVLVGARLAA
jgi:CrcB protein